MPTIKQTFKVASVVRTEKSSEENVKTFYTTKLEATKDSAEIQQVTIKSDEEILPTKAVVQLTIKDEQKKISEYKKGKQ